MKLLFTTILLALSSCIQLISNSAQGDDPAKVKERITNLVEAQRRNKDWMKADSCPADLMPETSNPAKKEAAQCAAKPNGCLSACNTGDADSCYALARLIQDNDSIENDVSQVLYLHSCRLGIVSGCTNAAASLFERDDVQSVACAARSFDAACSKDDPWGCTMNGLALAEGVGCTKDIAKAKRALDKACEVSIDKNGPACSNAKETKAAMMRLEGMKGNN